MTRAYFFILLALTLLILRAAHAGAELTGSSGGGPNNYITGVFTNSAPAPPAPSFLLLADGVSFLLLTDGTSKLCLAGTC